MTVRQAVACIPEVQVSQAVQRHVKYIPSASDIQVLMNRVKEGKAPGEDVLPSGMYKQFAEVLAHVFEDLYAKVAITTREPLQWRGGQQLELFKGKGPHDRCESYRGIFLADIAGKYGTNTCAHTWTRSPWISSSKASTDLVRA